MTSFRELDDTLQEALGIPYLRATRDNSIHDRLSYLVHVLGGLPGDRFRVLDVGCGSGMALRYLAGLSAPGPLVEHYTGIDLSATRLRARYKGIALPHVFLDVDLDDSWHLGFLGAFDLVWCSEVLEHLSDDAGVFAKICQTVSPGGHVVVTVPTRAHRERMGARFPQLLAVSARQDGGHVRVGYSEQDLATLCVGTPAKFVRADFATRATESYMRRSRWPPIVQPFNAIWNTLTRGRPHRFLIRGDASVSRDFLSIAGVYQVAPVEDPLLEFD